MLSTKLIGIIGTVALLLAISAPLYYLILFDLILILFVGQWSIGGVRFDPTDLIIVSLAVGILLRGRTSLGKHIPNLLPWVTLATFLSLSYLASPENTRNLTDPIRITYQLYRYCWKPVLYYPICAALLGSRKRAHLALVAATVGADFCALIAIRQGYSGLLARGPFTARNELGMALEMPFVIALSGLFFPLSRAHQIFSGVSLGLLARAMLFSSSRGAMVAAAVGSAFLFSVAYLLPDGRRRLFRMIPVAFVAVALLFVIRPDILERPSVRHAMSATEGTKSNTLQWRMTHRWPYFLNEALKRPILGTGTAVGASFGRTANTPHNGYLALASRNGFVVAVLFLYFFYRLCRNGLRVFRRTRDFHERIFAITLVAAVLGFMLHNIVDTGFTKIPITKVFWMACALGALRAHALEPLEAKVGTASKLPAPVSKET